MMPTMPNDPIPTVRRRRLRTLGVGSVGIVAALLVAGTVLGVDPSPTPLESAASSGAPSASSADSADPSASASSAAPSTSASATTAPSAVATATPAKAVEPAETAKPPKPDKAAKADKDKTPKAPITVTGTVTSSTDADGHTTYTLMASGKAYELGAGPSWWWGDQHPLAPYVGERVTVAGEMAEGSSEIDVETVDGSAVRTGTGKPPWAGGPKAVGERHPGWKAWHGAHPDGKPGKGQGNGQGRATAPGQLKKAAPAPTP